MTNRELWTKEFTRITRIAKGITKGVNIEFTFPRQPKRVDKKSIERLRRITPSTIRELIKQEEIQSKEAKVKIDITRAARVKAPEEASAGFNYPVVSPEERARRAKKASATRLKKGIKPFGNATPEERSRRAKKAAETRAEKGIKPFSKLTKEQRSAAAKKAAATRAAKGIKPFGGDITPEQRSERAKKAAATRKAKGIKPFGNLTPEQRSERAKKAAATRKANKLKRLNGDKVEFIDEETGEIEEEELENIDDEEIPDIDEYALIIENYLQQLQEYHEIHPQGFFIEIIIDKLYMFQGIYGERAVALALAKMADEGILLTVLVVYDTDYSGQAYLGKMVSFLTSNGVLTDEEGLEIWRNTGYTENYFDYMGGVEEEQEYLNRTYVWTDGV